MTISEINIPRLYIIKISKWFMVLMPVIVVFFMDNGLNMQQIFILKAINSVSIIALEIPSGYMADVLGRKKTLVLGSILGFIGFLAYPISFGFWGFVVAELFLGAGVSFISGSDSAILYDSLQIDRRENEYVKLEGRTISVGNFAEAIGGIIGGFLAAISLRYPAVLQAVIAFIAIPASLTLLEPDNRKNLKDVGIKQILKIVHISLFENKALSWSILFSSIMGCSTLTMAWFVQAYFKEINLPLEMYGIIWTVLNLSLGLVSLIAYKIENKIGIIWSAVIIGFALNAMYLLAGSIVSVWSLGFFLVFYLLRGIATPILKDYLNRLTDNEHRATILSVRSFIIRAIFAILAPLFGYVSDHYSIAQALILSGSLFILFSAISMIYFIKNTYPILKKERTVSK